MRKLFAFLLLSVCACAQSSRSGGSFLASSYANWQLVTTSAVPVAGTFPVSLSAGSATTSDGRQFLPLRAGFPVLVDNGANQEIVTPATTANCSLRPNPYAPCTITATFTKAHPVGTLIRTSSFGLQEAIADAISNGGGVVMVDSTWRGATANITGAIGTTAAAIQDNRSGTPSTYAWNGSAYAVTVSVSGCSSSNGNITCPANINAPSGDVVALNHIATQPTDSLTFFGNPLLDPNCNFWNWDSNAPPAYLQLCVDTQFGQLTSLWQGADKIYYYGGPQAFPAGTAFGNNSGSSAAPSVVTQLNSNLATSGSFASIGGSANAYTACPTTPITALTTGTWVVLANGTNTLSNSGASTLNVCGLGVKNINKLTSTGGLTALASGDIKFTSICPCNSFSLFYDGTEWVLPITASLFAPPTFTYPTILFGTPLGMNGTVSAQTITANVHNLTQFYWNAGGQVTTTQVTYFVQTADNTANNYDIGILDANCNLLVHIGATAGTTFSPTTGTKTLAWTGAASTTLVPGTSYYIDVTTNCAASCAKLGGTDSAVPSLFNGNTGTTTGGAVASLSCPANAFSIANGAPNPMFR